MGADESDRLATSEFQRLNHSAQDRRHEWGVSQLEKWDALTEASINRCKRRRRVNPRFAASGLSAPGLTPSLASRGYDCAVRETSELNAAVPLQTIKRRVHPVYFNSEVPGELLGVERIRLA